MTPPLTRRTVLLGAAASTMLAACAATSRSPALPPIVFVHGNGDTAGLWMTTLWRFESNGWPRERLYAVDIPYPLARDDDTKAQEGRSSTSENLQYLSLQVDKVLRATGAAQVVLVANSRGGNAVRNYIANGDGAANVSHAILGGTPNHGVYADPKRSPNAEFNGAGAFLSGLNAPKGPSANEVTPGVKWMTIRSDSNDKYAQPDGAAFGFKGMVTNVTYEGPELRGAMNIVIDGVDHRETAYSAKAFAQMFRFITGNEPVTLGVKPEARAVLDGKVSGYFAYTAQGAVATNLALVGSTVEVYATNQATGERLGPPVHRKVIAADGMWGPFNADPQAHFEFVITAPGYAITHLYCSPFPRSSSLVYLRAEKLLDSDKSSGAVLTLRRPRGYFSLPRDQISLDGQSPPPGVAPGVASVNTSKLMLGAGDIGRMVVGTFNDERIVGRAWPSANNEVTYLELTD